MKIEAVIWLRDVVDKLIKKHRVETAEVEEALNNQPKIRFVEKGLRRGEDVYLALGQTDAVLCRVVHLQEDPRRINLERKRHGSKRKKADMARSKSQTLPVPKNIDDLAEFFETHDMGEYWQEMPEAEFDIDIKKRTHLVAIDEEIAAKITTIAKSKKTSSESLINAWLREKIRRAS